MDEVKLDIKTGVQLVLNCTVLDENGVEIRKIKLEVIPEETGDGSDSTPKTAG